MLGDYHPGDCVVSLKAGGDPVAVNAVVANCGIQGLSPRGGWLNGNAYVMDDVVVLDGSSWRAKKAVPAGIKPGFHDGGYWEKFVSRGEDGIMGRRALRDQPALRDRRVPQGPKVQKVRRVKLVPPVRLVPQVRKVCRG